MSCMPCCATSKPARSAKTRRSSAWSARRTGCGLPWIPESKLLLVIDVGTRTLEMAQRWCIRSWRCLAPDCCAAVFDRWSQGVWHRVADSLWLLDTAERRRDTGPLPKPRWMPLPAVALRPGGEVVPAKAYRRRQVSGGVWHHGASAAGACRRVVARSIRRLWKGSTWTSVSGWRRWADGSTRCARARTADSISWCCSRRTTTLSCPMRACASRC